MTTEPSSPSADTSTENSASTHVLVSAAQVDKLRELSRKTRIAQSEYLREAVDDLLAKYPSALP
ncbi:MAG: ribbon-helix-helix domain-containing protein [Proteobacteria bacterium]|nr:ribbon-helix-helix domain-containing protein [Cystobacterineae bacterium]MCL2314329.1 ribbon-helix-helix domain-containing protein [Pseudomonadota bacterium]